MNLKYSSMYDHSLQNVDDDFGVNKQKELIGTKKYTKIKNVNYSKDDVSIKWYEDGKLNVSYNCIDRHAKKILIGLQ